MMKLSYLIFGLVLIFCLFRLSSTKEKEKETEQDNNNEDETEEEDENEDNDGNEGSEDESDGEEDNENEDEEEEEEESPETQESVDMELFSPLIKMLATRLSPLLTQEALPSLPPRPEFKAEDSLNFILNYHYLIANITESVMKIIMPTLMNIMYSGDLSESCSTSMLRLLSGIREQKPWAYKFLDSSSRMPSGILEGTIADYGEYDECLNIVFDDNSARGKYCMSRYMIPMPPKPKDLQWHHSVINISGTPLEDTILGWLATNANSFYVLNGFRAGICIPSTCNPHELELVINKIVFPLSNMTVFINKYCDVKDEPIVWTRHQIVAISIIGTLLSLVIIATFYDYILISYYSTPSSSLQDLKPSSSDSIWHQILISFSAIKNTQNLFKESNTRSNALNVIHGMRVMAISWILIGHIYLLQFFQVYHAFKRTIGEMPRLTWIRYQFLKTGSFLQVDTFFVISGVIVTYVTMDVVSSYKAGFNYYIYVLHRWLRYTPALVGCILLYFLLPHMSSGPIFKENIALQTGVCEKYWYRNFLYFNNFYDQTGNCATQTWFLAVDFQLYLIAPIFFFLMGKHLKLGLTITILFLFASFFFGFIAEYLGGEIVLKNAFNLDALIDEQGLYDALQYLYWHTWQHVTPYMMGIIVGFLIKRHPNVKLWRSFEIFMWFISFYMFIHVQLLTIDWMDVEAKEDGANMFQRRLFLVIYKVMWCLLPTWIIYASSLGRGGIIARFLSLKFFIPLSRLTYCFYLASLIPITLWAYSVRYTKQFDEFYNWSAGCFIWFISLFLGYLIHLLFESPLGNLHKLTLKWVERTIIGGDNEGSNKGAHDNQVINGIEESGVNERIVKSFEHVMVFPQDKTSTILTCVQINSLSTNANNNRNLAHFNTDIKVDDDIDNDYNTSDHIRTRSNSKIVNNYKNGNTFN